MLFIQAVHCCKTNQGKGITLDSPYIDDDWR